MRFVWGAATVAAAVAFTSCGSGATTAVPVPRQARVSYSGQVPEGEDAWEPPFQTERVVIDRTLHTSGALKQAEAALLAARGWRRISETDPRAIELVSHDQKTFAAVLTIDDALAEGPPAYRTSVNTELIAEQRARRSGTPAILVIAGPMK